MSCEFSLANILRSKPPRSCRLPFPITRRIDRVFFRSGKKKVSPFKLRINVALSGVFYIIAKKFVEDDNDEENYSRTHKDKNRRRDGEESILKYVRATRT